MPTRPHRRPGLHLRHRRRRPLISTAVRTQQQAMMTGFSVTFPAQMLSGIMYPLENMPKAIYWITYLNPLRYFVTLMRNITLKGGDVVVFLDEYLADSGDCSGDGGDIVLSV